MQLQLPQQNGHAFSSSSLVLSGYLISLFTSFTEQSHIISSEQKEEKKKATKQLYTAYKTFSSFLNVHIQYRARFVLLALSNSTISDNKKIAFTESGNIEIGKSSFTNKHALRIFITIL